MAAVMGSSWLYKEGERIVSAGVSDGRKDTVGDS